MATILGTTGDDNPLLGTNDAGDTVVAFGGSDNVAAGDGNDVVLLAPGGSDTVDGGAGTDTVVLTGNFASYDISFDGDNIVLDNGAGTVETVTGVEVIVFDDQVVRLVGADSELATIQAAVDAARDGDTILVAAGDYIEQVVVDDIDNLTIRAAAGAQVTIQAPADLVETARSSSDREIHGVLTVMNGINVVVDNIDIDGAGRGNTVDEGGGAGQANFYGVFYRNASGGLLDVDITGVRDPYPGGHRRRRAVVSGVQRGVGLVVDNDTLLAFTMTGGSISDFQKNATVFNRADLDISGVTITGGGAQTINAQNGIQVSNSTGTISGNTITGIGYAGAAERLFRRDPGLRQHRPRHHRQQHHHRHQRRRSPPQGRRHLRLRFRRPTTAAAAISGNTISLRRHRHRRLRRHPAQRHRDRRQHGHQHRHDRVRRRRRPRSDGLADTAYDVDGLGGNDFLFGAAGNDTFGLGNATSCRAAAATMCSAADGTDSSTAAAARTPWSGDDGDDSYTVDEHDWMR